MIPMKIKNLKDLQELKTSLERREQIEENAAKIAVLLRLIDHFEREQKT